MTLITEQKFIHADAPEDYGTGRECSRGSKCKMFQTTQEVGKLNRYTRPIVNETKDEKAILLCNPCNEEWIDSALDIDRFLGRTVKKGRAKRYKLPNLQTLRTNQGFSRRQLELESNVNRTTIARIEEGEWAGTGVAGKLAQALGVKTEELREAKAELKL